MQSEDYTDGYGSDNSDEYWDNWKREFDAKRAEDPESHETFVMNAWLRKHPGMTSEDYMDYRRKQATSDSVQQDIEQASPPSPHTVRNLEAADRRAQDTPWVRQPRPQPAQTLPKWQQDWADSEGVPREYWQLPEQELIAKVKEHQASIAGRGRGIQTRNAPNKVVLPIAMPYGRNTSPEDQAKRAEWLAAIQAIPPLTEEQMVAPEEPPAPPKSPKSHAERLQTLVHNMIASANEMHNDLNEILKITKESNYNIAETPDKLRYYLAAILLLYGQHSELLDIRNLNDDALAKSEKLAAEWRRVNDNNNDNSN